MRMRAALRALPRLRRAIALAVAGAAFFAIGLVDASPPEVDRIDLEVDGPGSNVDDPCFWIDPADPGASLMFVTAKDSGLVEVWSIPSGALVGTVAGFARPNNCVVEGDLLLTTDSLRGEVQAHHLPDLTPVGIFGQDLLNAEGIDVLTTAEGTRLVYVTDSGDASVHVYDLDTGTLVRSFPTGFGLTIEPILADDHYQRIFVSREEKTAGPRGIGLFMPDGTFQQEFSANVFGSDPEGLAIYACGDGGYLIAADQMSKATQFEIFDRVTLTHLGTFRMQDGTGEYTNSTDGIDIVQTPLPGYPNGLLAACDGCGSNLPDEMDVVSWDRIATVMNLELCPNGVAPDCAATPCIERILSTADAGVSSATPNANFGADPALKVDANPTDQVLLRFTVPDLTGYQIVEANVRLTVDTASGSPSVTGGQLYRAAGPWDESTVTFATRPQAIGEPVATAAAVEEAQAVDFDVRAVVAEGAGAYDFVLVSDSSDGARYRSREAGQSPPVLILTVRVTDPPELRITSPADDTVIPPGAPFDLAGVATDRDDGDLSASIAWRSDKSGALGIGSPLHVSGLAAGSHTITAEVTNTAGLGARATVRVHVESAPSVSISQPTAGATLPAGAPVALAGSAQDAEDGDLGAAIAWSSDRDGALGTGAALSVVLSEGTHHVRALVADSHGNPASAEVTVVVAPAAPAVRIDSPATGTTVATGTAVTLAGSATDPIEGNLAANLAWRSSLQGTLGTGASIVANGLQIGTHVITATVTNARSLTGQASITLRVAPATLSVVAAADTYVDAGSPTANFGAETTFIADGTPARIGLLRFVVSGSAGLMIERAVVRLTVSGSGNSESISGGKLHALTDTGWQERTVTYATRPPIDGLALGTLGPVAKGEVVEFDVTSAIPGDGAVTFALETTGTDAVRYRTREGAAGHPTLVVTLGSRINLPPSVAITAPADGTTVDHATPITFSATATDPEDGDLRRAIVWTSGAGSLGSGPVITATLPEGTHVVSASVTDAGGRSSAQQVTVTVRPPAPANTPPRVTIDEPVDGRSFTLPEAAVFAATALDDQEGNISARIRWTSDRDGALGTGSGLTRVLSEGTHRITASVTDAGGLGASASITVAVVAPTTLTFPPVADTYVDEASPNSNFGNNPQLRIDSDTIRTVLMRFVVSGVGTRSVQSATLRLQVDTLAGSDGPDGGSLVAITPSPWQERTVNWVTRPPTDGPVLARVGAVGFSQVVELDATAAIRADGTYELALVGNSSNAVNYRAREATTGRPQLILTLGGYAPEVSITSPPDQTVVVTTNPIALTGSALDVEDGDISDALRWSSDRDGLFGTGASVSSGPLSIGTHVVTAAATDSSGRSGQAQLTVRVRAPDVGPTVTIGQPTPDVEVNAGTLVTLAATATDGDGTDISSRIQWSSSRDGARGTGAQRIGRLSEGSHTLTASARDDDGGVGSSHVTLVVLPTAPIVTVATPADGTTVLAGAGLIFRGTATDATDGDLSPVLLWMSDRDGQIGLGQSFSTARLSVGTHHVTAAVADSGDLVGEEFRTVVVLPNDRPPVVTLLAPLDGAPLLSEQPVLLSVTATDAEDGNLGTSVRWTSSLDGPLGTGDTLVVPALSAGTHTLTATVADASSQTVGASVTVTLSSPVRTFTVATDTYVDAGVPTQSFGNVTEVLVDGSPQKQGFLRFAVTGIAPFAVGQARVRLTAASSNGAPSESGGTLQSLSDNAWSNTTTWNTRPTIDGPVLASQGKVVINQAVDFDVTSVVRGDGSFNFALTTTSDDGVHYRSRESTMGKPQLIVSRRQETAPVVSISAPLSGTRVPRGMPVAFTARAADAEDGDLSAAIVWTSSLDGPLGVGGTLTLGNLTVGRHVVTATVSDRVFRQGTAIIDLTVTPGEVGFADFAYGADVDVDLDKATAQKPESKLWHHDGAWWATLFRPEAGAYRIHRLDRATEAWIDTGALVDERPRSRQDVLWDGEHLYVTSRHGEDAPQNRLLRYHYDGPERMFVLDAGFPTDLPGGGTEALTIAKDTTGTLWITYTLNGEVYLAHTTGSDDAWAKPALLPVPEGTTVSSDDISGVVSLLGKVGVFWSNQLTETFYFAVHDDGAPASEWRLETVASGPKLADDHFNLKLASDGRLFAAVKTSQTTPGAIHIGLLVRSQNGVWSDLQPVAGADGTPTRPLCVLDEVARRVYVFFSNSQSAIYYKTSDLDSIAFPDGRGTPFIASDVSANINNPTGTKQSVDASTGIVVVASGSERYWHGTIGVP